MPQGSPLEAGATRLLTRNAAVQSPVPLDDEGQQYGCGGSRGDSERGRKGCSGSQQRVAALGNELTATVVPTPG